MPLHSIVILTESVNSDLLIAWSDDGTSFIIRNQAEFTKQLLPYYYKVWYTLGDTVS